MKPERFTNTKVSSHPSRWGRIIFIIFVCMYLSYSFYLYSHTSRQFNQKDAHPIADGRLVWQKYNCQSCHQLYSLGGYLGPDLTNYYSDTLKGDAYLEALVKSGTDIMPAFNMSPNELKQIQDFLKAVNLTGISDPRHFRINTIAGIDENN